MMMRQRMYVVIVAVIVLLAGTLFPAARANATDAPIPTPTQPSGWPLDLGPTLYAHRITTQGTGSFTLLSCQASTSSAPNAWIYHNGLLTTQLAESDGACGRDDNSGATSQDGTSFSEHSTQNSGDTAAHSYLQATKNGAVKWQTQIDTNLGTSCSTPSTSVMTGPVAIGGNGVVYAVIHSGTSELGCEEYFAGFNASTGAQLFKEYLDTLSYPSTVAHIWVYDGYVLVLDQYLQVKKYGLDGTEESSYQISWSDSGEVYQGVAANAQGGVYLINSNVQNRSEGMEAHYMSPDGTQYDASLGQTTSDANTEFTTTESGGLISFGGQYAGMVSIWDPTSSGTSSVSTTVLDPPSGYQRALIDSYWQDQNGNVVVVRDLENYGSSGWIGAGVTVDEINGGTGGVTNLFYLPSSSDGTYQPSASVNSEANGDIYGNTLYVQITGASNDGNPQIYMISLGSQFGTAIRNTPQMYTPPVSTKVNYVAMGDSFSSGEGNPPFITGTDVTGSLTANQDTCHRSSKAYPILLDEDSNSNLNLEAFVACSGATVADINNINQEGSDEGPQAEVLDSNVGLVTMTMGGNDVGFGHTIETCLENTEGDCDSAVQDMAAAAASISTQQAWTDSYETIRSALNNNAPIVIVGYPDVFAQPNEQQNPCTWGDGTAPTTGNPITTGEEEQFSTAASDLNNDLSSAVTAADDPNLYFVNPETTFEGHGYCTSDPWFNGVIENIYPDIQAGSYHPNAAGQQAYATLIGDYLTEHGLG